RCRRDCRPMIPRCPCNRRRAATASPTSIVVSYSEHGGAEMTRQVVMVEVSQIEHTFPLASAYMHNYAKKFAHTAADYEFVMRPYYVGAPAERIIHELKSERADVYTFSCYCWNMK